MSVPLSEAAQELSQRPGKKVLILFTDGDDNSSALNASTAVARAKKGRRPLYTIAEGEARPSKNLRKLVDDLSQRTGGAAYEAKKPGHIERVFHEISEDLRHYHSARIVTRRTVAGTREPAHISAKIR